MSLSPIQSLAHSLCAQHALLFASSLHLSSSPWSEVPCMLLSPAPLRCLSVTVSGSLHQTEHSCCKAGDHKRGCVTVLEDFGDGTRLRAGSEDSWRRRCCCSSCRDVDLCRTSACSLTQLDSSQSCRRAQIYEESHSASSLFLREGWQLTWCKNTCIRTDLVVCVCLSGKKCSCL